MKTPLFTPREYVVITLFGLQYKGRVDRGIWDGFEWTYSVQYADDKGDLQRQEFYEDEVRRDG